MSTLAAPNQPAATPASVPTKTALAQLQTTPKSKKPRMTKKLKALQTASPSSPDLLTALPPELRNRIYEFALIDDKPQNVRRHKRKAKWQEPGLLRTSKAIRTEALSLYYKNNAFDIRITLKEDEFVDAVTWLNSIRRRTGLTTFMDVRLHVMGAPWHHLSAFGALTEFLRTTGLRVAIITTIQEETEHGQQEISALRAQGYCLFVTVTALYINSNVGVRGVLDLGESAHTQGWDKQTLKTRVDAEVQRLLARGKGRKASKQYERLFVRDKEAKAARNATALPAAATTRPSSPIPTPAPATKSPTPASQLPSRSASSQSALQFYDNYYQQNAQHLSQQFTFDQLLGVPHQYFGAPHQPLGAPHQSFGTFYQPSGAIPPGQLQTDFFDYTDDDIWTAPEADYNQYN